MNSNNNNYFKQESKEDISKWCEIENMTKEVKDGMFAPAVVRAWSVIRHWSDGGESQYYVTFDNDGEYEVYDNEGNDLPPHSFNSAPMIDAVKLWDVKNQLTPSTLKTFGELIDEL